MTDDKLYTSLSANTIMAKVTNHFQRTKRITSSTDKHYSLDSEDCWNVSHQQRFFSELPPPWRSRYTNFQIIYWLHICGHVNMLWTMSHIALVLTMTEPKVYNYGIRVESSALAMIHTVSWLFLSVQSCEGNGRTIVGKLKIRVNFDLTKPNLCQLLQSVD